ncbi:MAG TPA: peptide deformylase [Gammaproteobacteria bacterium]|nr:peptide deformylase [Gammaproteobacteria bacterium]
MAIIRQVAQLGHPVLRNQAVKVEEINDPTIQSLIDDMLVTVSESNGVGIAAPQVYESVQIFIMASFPNSRYPNAPEMEPTAIINPEILWCSEEREKDWEGCLSVPGIRGLVPRHKENRVRYSTRDGRQTEETFCDFLARIFQHEYDHLKGISFLDRMETTQEIITDKVFQKLIKQE